MRGWPEEETKSAMDGGVRWRNCPLPEPHLGLLACGFILHRLRPWMLVPQRRFRLLSGWSLIIGGAVLVSWATRAAGSINLANPDRLVALGPYALSRHPMYVAWTSIYLGVALVLNTRWLIILSPLLLAFTHRTILAEERQLEKHLGDDYRAYKRRVGRYPLFSSAPAASRSS